MHVPASVLRSPARRFSLVLALLAPSIVAACAEPPPPPKPPAPAPPPVIAETKPLPPPAKETPPPPAAPALFPIATVLDAEIDVLPLKDGSGATIVARSLLAVVRGDTVTQDPAWLTGLPQAINADGIRIHRAKLAGIPAVGEPFSVDFAVGTVKMEGGSAVGAYAWKGPKGFAAQPASTKLKAVAGVPTSLDGTGEHWFPAPEGGVFIVRTNVPQLTIYRVDAQEKLRSTETFPLPDGVTDVSVLRFTAGEILAQGGKGGLFTLKDSTLTPITGPQSLPVARAAVTEDGSLWVITQPLPKAPAALFVRSGEGSWAKKALPEGRTPTRLWAGGNRVWLATSGAPGGNELWSDQPVKTPLIITAAHAPWTADKGPLPVTSDVPLGPGTSACAKPVVWVGETSSPALLATVAADEKAKGLPLLLTGGKPALLASGVKTTPPKQAAGSVVVVAGSFDEAASVAASLAPALAKLAPKPVEPRILCAVVKEKKKLGPVGAK